MTSLCGECCQKYSEKYEDKNNPEYEYCSECDEYFCEDCYETHEDKHEEE